MVATLYRTPPLDRDAKQVLGFIRDLWKQLQFSLQQSPRRWKRLVAKILRAKAIQGSNSIEGYVVSDENAMAAVGGQPRPEDADETAWENVVHYQNSMEYVLALAASEDFGYSKDLIRALHYMMLQHDSDHSPGLFRSGPIFVTKGSGEIAYEGPDAELVPRLVDDLCRQLTAADDDGPNRMIRAAMAHLNLVLIHPFRDGNGRMSRILQSLVLARGKVLDPTFVSIEEYLGKNTQSYYDVLAEVGQGKWSPGNDARPWIRYCLTAHYRQAWQTKLRMKEVSDIGSAIEAELARRKLPDRASVSLTNVARGNRLRNEDYRIDAEVSLVVASRDLRDLVEGGMLESVGETRGRHYVASKSLLQLAVKFRKPSPIPDPFESPLERAAGFTH